MKNSTPPPKDPPRPSASTSAKAVVAPLAPAPSPKGAARWFLLGIGLTSLFFFLMKPSESKRDASGKSTVRVERLMSGSQASGLSACAPSGSPCSKLEPNQQVPAGSRVKTDFLTRAVLVFADKSRIALDRATEVRIATASEPLRFDKGALTVEIVPRKTPLVFELERGKLETLGAKFGLRVHEDAVTVEVSSGKLSLVDRDNSRALVRAGEQGRIEHGAPRVFPLASLAHGPLQSDAMSEEPDEEPRARGLGQLVAKKPGSRDELRNAVRLVSHAVHVRIAGAMARTEVEESFSNTTDQTLEGIFRFPIPPSAQIERLSLLVDGKWVDGAFVDRDQAAAIWRGAIVNQAPESRPLMREEIVWVPGPWRDPALLEWQRGGRFELKIFPIPPRSERRVRLSYSQLVAPSGETRRYSCALPLDASEGGRVDKFAIDVEVRGHDPSFGVRSSGYELRRTALPDAARLELHQDGFAPRGDLELEYALPNRESELMAWAYGENPDAPVATDSANPLAASSDLAPYLAISLRPVLPRSTEDKSRALAIAVDASRSMFGESYARAKRLAARIVRELDPQDRVVLLACDSECRRAPGAISPGAEGERSARSFLDRIQPDGGSDPTRSIELAYRALGELDGREGRVLYIGDGTPTVGPVRPSHMEAEVRRSLPGDLARVTSVAVGSDSDLESLRALARGGGGVMVPYVPGEPLSEAAFAALGASYGRALRDVEVTLPEGLYAAAPARFDSIAAGAETLVVARMARPEVHGDVVLRGRVGAQPFERRYSLRVRASSQPSAAFVPRLYAAQRIQDLERDGGVDAKRDALDLSIRFSVASRYTSLLVLESPAMFRAFGLDSQRKVAEWSGEEAAETASAELETSPDDAPLSDGSKDSASRGLGGSAVPGSEGLARQSVAAPAAAAPAKSAKKGREADSDAFDLERKAEVSQPVPSNPLSLEPREIEPRRRWVPMRKIWERAGEIQPGSLPKSASFQAIEAAERRALEDPDRRESTRKLYALLSMAGQIGRAEQIVARWVLRDPLDVDALTARADLAARRGDRNDAVRLLGSVVDVQPGDIAAQRRLERLERWSGRAAEGCRHLVAAAEIHQRDAVLIADAVRCSQKSGDSIAEAELQSGLDEATRARVLSELAKPRKDDALLSGDLRLEASWSVPVDLDLSVIDSEGRRASWLGAPTRAVISADHVTTRGREELALRGTKPGEYVIEITRAEPSGPVSGEIVVRAAGTSRRLPFVLSEARSSVALVNLKMVSRLVPLDG